MPFETPQVTIDDHQELVTSIDLDKEDQNNNETPETSAETLDSTDVQSVTQPTIPGLIFQLPGSGGQTLTITTPPKNIKIRWGRILKGEHRFTCNICQAKFTKLCSLKTHQTN